jgi:hypothetical protein
MSVCYRREAHQQALSLEARHTLRQQQSRPLLGLIRKQIEIACPAALAAGSAGQGFQLHAHPWDKLTFRGWYTRTFGGRWSWSHQQSASDRSILLPNFCSRAHPHLPASDAVAATSRFLGSFNLLRGFKEPRHCDYPSLIARWRTQVCSLERPLSYNSFHFTRKNLQEKAWGWT